MALSRMQKGIAALVFALIAVIAIGYGGLRYIESGVVASIRTFAQQTPKDTHVTLGDVTYSMVHNRLVLTNIRAEYPFMGRTTVTTVGRVEINNPDATFLQAVANPATPLEHPVVSVADKITFNNASTGPDPAWGVTQGVYTNIKIDLAKVRELLKSGFSAEQIPKIIGLLSYASAESEGLSVTLKEDSPFEVPFQITMQSVKVREYTQGKLASAVITDMGYTLGTTKVGTLAQFTMEGVTPPPDALMEALNALDPEKDTVKMLELLGEILSGSEPLMKKCELKGLAATSYPASLARLTFTNPTTMPYACSLEIEHLILPAEADDMQLLRMVDLKQVDLSSAFSLTAPDKTGEFKSALSVTLANLGTADCRLDGVLPSELGKSLAETFRVASSEAALTGALGKLKIGRMELGYKDDGLLSRAAALTQAMLGMTPQQSLDYVRTFLEHELVNGAENPTATKAYVVKILSVLEKPGSLRLAFAAPKPLSSAEIEALPVPSPYETLEVIPGTQTLEEQVKALRK